MELSLEINRYQDTNTVQTCGEFHVIGANFSGKTIELEYNDNKKQISCIPPGQYTVRKRTSTKYGNHFHIIDVPNRDFILISLDMSSISVSTITKTLFALFSHPASDKSELLIQP